MSRHERLDQWLSDINAECLWTQQAQREEIACFRAPDSLARFIVTRSHPDRCQIYVSIAGQVDIGIEFNRAEMLLGLTPQVKVQS